jgi:hypothetical protein
MIIAFGLVHLYVPNFHSIGVKMKCVISAKVNDIES